MPGTSRRTSRLDRAPLSRERVLSGAVAVADAGGIAGADDPVAGRRSSA